MAVDRIIVSTAEMQAAINRYNGARESVNDAFSHMQSAMDHLDNCWKGPAWAAYVAKWQVIYGNISRTDAAIEKAITGLQNTIQQMDAATENIDSNTSKLQEGSDAKAFF